MFDFMRHLRVLKKADGTGSDFPAGHFVSSIAGLEHLQDLSVSIRSGAADLERMSTLTSLTRLSLDLHYVADPGTWSFQPLCALKGLRKLSLSSFCTSSRQSPLLASLATLTVLHPHLTNLQHLGLWGSEAARNLLLVTGFESLSHLTVSTCIDVNFHQLSCLANLTHLSADPWPQETMEEALQGIASLTTLQELKMARKFDDELNNDAQPSKLRWLALLPKLKTLWLHKNNMKRGMELGLPCCCYNPHYKGN